MLGEVVEEVLRRQPPRGMTTRIVAVDGHGGAGKSTFAEVLAVPLGASQIVHTDDFASWDEPVHWWPLLIERVLEPLANDERARFVPTSWDGPPRAPIEILPGGNIVLEGVTASREAFRPYLTFAIWIETPRELCLRRGIERDGVEAEEQWQHSLTRKEAYVVRERPVDHADRVIRGDA
jgi:uridine kinase